MFIYDPRVVHMFLLKYNYKMYTLATNKMYNVEAEIERERELMRVSERER